VIDDEGMTGAEKARVAIELGRIEKKFCDGADQHLQMLRLFTMPLVAQ
jgi:hypothetical protein